MDLLGLPAAARELPPAGRAIYACALAKHAGKADAIAHAWAWAAVEKAGLLVEKGDPGAGDVHVDAPLGALIDAAKPKKRQRSELERLAQTATGNPVDLTKAQPFGKSPAEAAGERKPEDGRSGAETETAPQSRGPRGVSGIWKAVVGLLKGGNPNRGAHGRFSRGATHRGAKPGHNITDFAAGRTSRPESVQHVLPGSDSARLREIAGRLTHHVDEKFSVEAHGIKASNTEHAVTLDMHGDKGTMLRRMLTRDGDGPLKMEASHFVAGEQGRGMARTIVGNTVDTARHLGVSQIDTHANMSVGGYAWAKFGYRPDQQSWDELRGHLSRSIAAGKADHFLGDPEKRRVAGMLASSDPKSIWALSDFKSASGDAAGKRLLLGTSWHGKLDLDDKDAMSRFAEYAGRK